MNKVLAPAASIVDKSVISMTRLLPVPILILTSMMGCSHSTGPMPLKDPRSYTWTIDTLAYPGSYQTLMQSIWGSSPRDVYVAGHNDGAYGKMYHFDGVSWNPVKLHSLEGGPFSNMGSFEGVYGFSSNSVFAVGDKFGIGNDYIGFAIRFDGKQWSELSLPSGNRLSSIWGGSPNDFWIGGYNGALFHYLGSSWMSDTVMNAVVRPDQFSFVHRITGTSSVLYALLGAPFPNGASRWYLLKHSQDRWSLEDSLTNYSWFDLWISPGGKLYRAVTGVEVRQGSTWKALMNSARIAGLSGTSDENLFAVGLSSPEPTYGEVYHFNGTDWYRFDNVRLPGVQFIDVWTEGSEVFVIGWIEGTPQKTIVLHGK